MESEKMDKGRRELDAKSQELANLAQDLDGKATRFRETEATRAEELRTWQATLESQQALLKEQRETFEQESVSQREAWAARVMRLERREIDVKDQEEKVHTDVEWVAQNEEEVTRREKAAQEASRSASLLKEEAERLKSEVEQRALEIDSRERSLREEIARHATELSKRTDALNALETEIGARRGGSRRHVGCEGEGTIAPGKGRLRSGGGDPRGSGGPRGPYPGIGIQRTPGRGPPHRIIRPGNGPCSPRARSERSGYPVRSRREKIPFRGDGETQAVGGPTDDPPIAAGPTERDDGVAGGGAGETRRGERGS